MKFLIFGGTGFIGRNLSLYVKEQGGEVLSVSRSGGTDSVTVDISKEAEFSNIDFKPDVIVNCASRIPSNGKTSRDPAFLRELFMTNVIGSVNIANWAVKNKVPSVINCSTLVVVKKPWPDPLTEAHFELPEGFHVGYAMSKLSQEKIMNQAVSKTDTHLMHLRLSAVYGEGMTPEGIIFRLMEKLLRNEEIVLTDARKNFLNLIHVRDVCRAIYALSTYRSNGNVMNLASGRAVSIMELAKTLKKITGSNSSIKDEETDNPPSQANIDTSKLKKAIGNLDNDFLDLREGLTGIVQTYRR